MNYGVSDDGQAYIIMEYVEGQPLSNIIAEEAPITFRRFQSIFLPLLSALEHAHSKGIIHRDIKPSNIMIQRDQQGDETAKLVDFGIAKAVADCLDSTAQIALTKTGITIGSPTYMSPEQCQAKELDCRSDLYSLACVMYESLNGAPPFVSDSNMDVMYKHLHETPISTKELSVRMEIPEVLVKAIMWGLKKEPAKRPESAAKYRARISTALEEVTLDRAPSVAGKSKTKLSGVVRIWLPFALIVLAGLVAVPVFLLDKKPKAPANPTIARSNSSKAQESLREARDLYALGKARESLAKSEEAIAFSKRGSRSTLADAEMCACDAIHIEKWSSEKTELYKRQLKYSMDAFMIFSSLNAEQPKLFRQLIQFLRHIRTSGKSTMPICFWNNATQS
jgi:serine/threonine protein kinase